MDKDIRYVARKAKLSPPKTPGEAFEDARRYYENAKEVLRKSPIENEIYKDKKYVKEACGIGYLSALCAIDGYLLADGVSPRELPTSLIEYEKALQKIPRNGKLMASMTIVYQNLHIFGYYRNGVGTGMIKEGFKHAKLIIERLLNGKAR